MNQIKKPVPQIMYESPEAASIQTVTGWVSANGQFWGNDEHMARWVGATHRVCENNPEHGVHEVRSWCKECHRERREAKFAAMARVEWDQSTPVVIFDTDRYFFDADELRDFLVDEDIKPEDVQLVICKPNKARETESSAPDWMPRSTY
jgi:hypothetical protein